MNTRIFVVFGILTLILLSIGTFQSWSLALSILNICLISAVMSLGLNIQWGYGGIFNVGIMGFAALGGLSVVLISQEPVTEAVSAGGMGMLIALAIITITLVCSVVIYRRTKRISFVVATLALGYVITRLFYSDASAAIESVNPSFTGYLGGLGLPVLFSWVVAGGAAAAAAWGIGKISLGLRTDYLAIATLGISEIIIAIIKNEDWLSRGVKNVSNIPRPVPYELDLQQAEWFQHLVHSWYADTLQALPLGEQTAFFNMLMSDVSIIVVKLCYASIFVVVLVTFIILANKALNSPWGRMIRAMRDNEVAAAALGKDIKKHRLQIFMIGSAIIGIAGAMLVTYDGQFTPGSYNPLRYTFLIWVMVIIGGSGNNLGSVVGGFIIWIMWIEAEPFGFWFIDMITTFLADDNGLKLHLLENAQYMRLVLMGVVLLLVMRFSPRGILPEEIQNRRKL